MRRGKILSNAYIFLILIFLYLPMALVVIYSFNVSKSSAVWTGFTWDWYKQMVKDRALIEALGTSVKVGALTCVVSAALGTIGAVALQTGKSRAVKVTRGFVQMPLMIPEIVLGVALLVVFNAIGLKYGILTLVLAHSTFCIPYVFILVHIRLRMIDPAIYGAARDLGARRITVFRTITMPLIAPAVASGMLLAFAMSFDDVVISFFVAGTRSQTLPPLIYSMVRRGVTPKINALYTIMLLVVFTVVGVMQVLSYIWQRDKNERRH